MKKKSRPRATGKVVKLFVDKIPIQTYQSLIVLKEAWGCKTWRDFLAKIVNKHLPEVLAQENFVMSTNEMFEEILEGVKGNKA